MTPAGALHQCPQLARQFDSLRGIDQIEQAINLLREKFRTVQSLGPVWAGQVATEHGVDEEYAARDAFERCQRLL